MQYPALFHGAARRIRPALAGLVLLAGACSEIVDVASSPGAELRQVVVLNAGGRSLTVVPLGSADIRGIPLGGEGSPTTLAVRSGRAVVPMGGAGTVKVVNLRTLAVEHTVALPAGSGATGAAFLNDTVALVGNPGLNSVSPVNVLRGTAGNPIPVGTYPRAIGVSGQLAFVLNGNLDAVTLQPLGPGSITIVNQQLAAGPTLPLSGFNPSSLAFRGRELFVLNAGTWNGNNSSLSVVDLALLREDRVQGGVGNFMETMPASLATFPGKHLFVASHGVGLLEYDPDARVMVRSASAALVPGEMLPVSAVQMDEVALYTLHPGDCTGPGKLLQVTPSGGVVSQASVGTCPIALALSWLPG